MSDIKFGSGSAGAESEVEAELRELERIIDTMWLCQEGSDSTETQSAMAHFFEALHDVHRRLSENVALLGVVTRAETA